MCILSKKLSENWIIISSLCLRLSSNCYTKKQYCNTSSIQRMLQKHCFSHFELWHKARTAFPQLLTIEELTSSLPDIISFKIVLGMPPATPLFASTLKWQISYFVWIALIGLPILIPTGAISNGPEISLPIVYKRYKTNGSLLFYKLHNGSWCNSEGRNGHACHLSI